jgi:hypothetical protein
MTSPANVIHIQIAVDEVLAFAACDEFHRECVWATGKVPVAFLDNLVSIGVIRSYNRSDDS